MDIRQSLSVNRLWHLFYHLLLLVLDGCIEILIHMPCMCLLKLLLWAWQMHHLPFIMIPLKNKHIFCGKPVWSVHLFTFGKYFLFRFHFHVINSQMYIFHDILVQVLKFESIHKRLNLKCLCASGLNHPSD